MRCGRKIDGKGSTQKKYALHTSKNHNANDWALDILLPSKFQIERTMKELQSILKWAILIIGGVGLIVFLGITFNKVYFNTSWEIDAKLAADFGSFVGGFVGTIFSLIGTLVVAYTFVMQFRQSNQMFEEQNKQNRKSEATNNFFKMIDFQNTLIEQMELPTIKDGNEKGRKVFVTSKEQIELILAQYCKLKGKKESEPTFMSIPDLNDDELFDLVYALFYYGLPDRGEDYPTKEEKEDVKPYWMKIFGNKEDAISSCVGNISTNLFNEDYCKNEKVREWLIRRKNQPYLSSYFQNLYGAINLVDSNFDFEKSEKENLINILRAQLSTPELYILDIHRRSKISEVAGEDWSTYIDRYDLLKNLPKRERFEKEGISNRIIKEE